MSGSRSLTMSSLAPKSPVAMTTARPLYCSYSPESRFFTMTPVTAPFSSCTSCSAQRLKKNWAPASMALARLRLWISVWVVAP